MSSTPSAWLAVVTPPPMPYQLWRGVVVRLGPHADSRAGHHWWRMSPASTSSGADRVRAFVDDEGATCAVELISDSREGLGALLEQAGMRIDALGSPTLFHMSSEDPRGDGWVWPLDDPPQGFPYKSSAG